MRWKKRTILFLTAAAPALSCKIQGTDSGVCTDEYLPSTYGDDRTLSVQVAQKRWMNGTDGPCRNGEGDHCMPFCGKWIANYYAPCVPAPMSFAQSKGYPGGRHKKFSVREKDRWVEETVTNVIANRIKIEINKTAMELGVNENGKKGKNTPIRFYNNPDCMEAYKKYFCWINFPRCDELTGASLPTCTSSCKNFFQTCGYEESMHRCGPTEFMNGYEKEEPLEGVGYSRALFPGQPFQQNEYHKKTGEPKIVCTPSIKGDAASLFVISISGAIYATVISTMLIYY